MLRRTRRTRVLIIALGAAFGLLLGQGALALRAEPPADKAEKKARKPKDGKKDKKKSKKKPIHGFKVGPREVVHFEIEQSVEGNTVSFKSPMKGHEFEGKSSQITGTLDANPHVLHSAKGKFSVPWTSIDTGNPMRNQHMTSDPWVDAGAHPDIVFTLEGIEKLKGNDKRGTKLKATLVGTFAINGAEKKMKIPATLEYQVADKMAGSSDDSASAAPDGGDAKKEGIRIEARFGIGLKDFGIVGKEVGKNVAAKPEIRVSLFLPIKAEEKSEPKAPPQPGRTRRGPRNR